MPMWIDGIIAAVGGEAELRPIAGQRLRHVLVGRAQRCALRVQRRIILIGLHQGPFQRIRRPLPAADARTGHRRAGNGQNVRPPPSIRRTLPPTTVCSCAATSDNKSTSRPTRPPTGPNAPHYTVREPEKMSEIQQHIHARNKNWAFVGTNQPNRKRPRLLCAVAAGDFFADLWAGQRWPGIEKPLLGIVERLCTTNTNGARQRPDAEAARREPR